MIIMAGAWGHVFKNGVCMNRMKRNWMVLAEEREKGEGVTVLELEC